MGFEKINRVIMIVLDSFGIGALPDAAKYGDVGSSTFGHIAMNCRGIRLPNMQKLGLCNIDVLDAVAEGGFIEKQDHVVGCFGACNEASASKETMVGHWEMMGVYVKEPFPTYPNGFPKEVIEELEQKTGTKFLCNRPASGTEIIKELGKEHMQTGHPILYTSADSTMQIAAHEEIITIEKLYEICKTAREVMRGKHEVCKIIARPFVGEEGNFTRTTGRHDYAIDPISETALEKMVKKGYSVSGVGKIRDIFNGKGISEYVYTYDNMDGVDKTIDYMNQSKSSMVFTNLVEYDMLWGHRRDVLGYAKGLEAFDKRLPEIMALLKDTDMLIITADHGCDPTFRGTDHTREYVPLLVYGKSLKQNVNLGIRKTFADTAATLAEIYDLSGFEIGDSYLSQIKRS